jgi:hypothetical protein
MKVTLGTVIEVDNGIHYGLAEIQSHEVSASSAHVVEIMLLDKEN